MRHLKRPIYLYNFPKYAQISCSIKDEDDRNDKENVWMGNIFPLLLLYLKYILKLNFAIDQMNSYNLPLLCCLTFQPLFYFAKGYKFSLKKYLIGWVKWAQQKRMSSKAQFKTMDAQSKL